VRSILLIIMTAIIALSYAGDQSVKDIIDGSINFVESTINGIQEVPAVVEEKVEEVVDSET